MTQISLPVVTSGLDGWQGDCLRAINVPHTFSLPSHSALSCPLKPPVVPSFRKEEREKNRTKGKGYALAESVSFSLDDNSFPGNFTQGIFFFISLNRVKS